MAQRRITKTARPRRRLDRETELRPIPPRRDTPDIDPILQRIDRLVDRP